ncbi:hypothetical protein CLOM_g797 [Closterium sp. NIES-68]|nr:hypothetical protein CLOM_g797 [Closterium sp. NIES-68]GJP64125.1 hypothetical protein CLOP_g21146 [Closterium sp. NIES-67]
MNVLVTGPPGVGKTTLITRVIERVKDALPAVTLRGFTTEEVRRAGERIGFDIVTLDGTRVALARLSHSDFSSPANPCGSSGTSASTSTSTSSSSSSGGGGRSSSRSSVRSEYSRNSERWGRVGKYSVDIAAVDQHVLPILSLATPPPPLHVSQPTLSPSLSPSPPASAAAAAAPVAPSPATFSSSSSPRGTLWVVDEIGKMELLSARFAAAITALLDAPLPLLASIPVAMHGRDLPQVAAIRARPDVSIVHVSRSNRDHLVAALSSQLLALIHSSADCN